MCLLRACSSLLDHLLNSKTTEFLIQIIFNLISEFLGLKVTSQQLSARGCGWSREMWVGVSTQVAWSHLLCGTEAAMEEEEGLVPFTPPCSGGKVQVKLTWFIAYKYLDIRCVSLYILAPSLTNVSGGPLQEYIEFREITNNKPGNFMLFSKHKSLGL